MRCIIVDDELNALKSLALDLDLHKDQIELVAQFSCSQTALQFLKQNDIDIVFLDIEMPGLSGLQLLDRFPDRVFFTVFTTAHSSYAIQAIRKNVCDYLLKPIDADELALCLQRLRHKFEKNNQAGVFGTEAEEIQKREQLQKKIKIFADGKILFLEPAEILFCQADGSYTTLHCQDGGRIVISQNLKSVGSWLPEHLFLRVHHSYIVNCEKIKEFLRQENYLVLVDESKVPVSRQRRNEILKLF